MILTVTLNPSIDKLYLVERLTPETVMRVKECRNTPGGKGLNVARVAAKLGEPVRALGFLGGFNGQYLESLLAGSGVEPAFTKSSAETRSCINVWDGAANRSTEFLEPGAPVSPEEWAQFLADFTARLPEADVVTISGSAPAGVPEDAYPTLIRLCRERAIPVLLDTSGARLASAIAAKPTLIKPNLDEIRQITGKEAEETEARLEALRALRGAGVACPVLSLGADGAILMTEEGALWGRPPKITPKNTVGCGDTMLAGFAVGLAKKQDMETTFRLALAVSAAGALSPATGDFDPTDFRAILPEVTISRL